MVLYYLTLPVRCVIVVVVGVEGEKNEGRRTAVPMVGAVINVYNWENEDEQDE